MADLNDLQSAQSVKIVGANESGVETGYVNSTENGIMVDGSAVTQPTVDLSSLVPLEFDEVAVTAKNGNGDPTTILYKLSSVTVATLTVTYDIDGDFQSIVRS